jgi:hypothetical protein
MEKTCKRCGFRWPAIKDSPKQCPYCKSYKWNVSLKETAATCKKMVNELSKGLTGGK